MKITYLLFAALLIITSCVSAQKSTLPVDNDAAYVKTTNERAHKIVSSLSVSDSTTFYKAQEIIAGQYQNLNRLHSSRDEAIKQVKASAEAKEVIAANVKTAEEATAQKINVLHQQYVKQLSALLTEVQVAKVKDGMTYNVVNITYNGYLDMLPNLTVEQKKQIMTWLVEAREHAMDAETSEKKHGWFGKYKGRINNYLSAARYDLKKEGDAWEQRRKEREAAKKSTN